MMFLTCTTNYAALFFELAIRRTSYLQLRLSVCFVAIAYFRLAGRAFLHIRGVVVDISDHALLLGFYRPATGNLIHSPPICEK